MALHIHVDAREKTLPSRCRLIVRNAVRHSLADRVVVADHEPLEGPFVPQNLRQREWIRAGWDLIERVEGAHECCSAFVKRCTERRQVNLAEQTLGDFSSVVLS